ncbi:MAG: M28 family peptidase [Bacteroidota bacterium]
MKKTRPQLTSEQRLRLVEEEREKYLRGAFAMMLYCCLLLPFFTSAQSIITEKDFLKAHIGMFASPAMHGRGYVQDGEELASALLQRKFTEFGLKRLPGMDSYVQPYAFPVNTFPGSMYLELNDRELVAGKDFLIDAGSVSFAHKNLKAERRDLSRIKDSAGWQQVRVDFDDRHVYVLEGVDSLCQVLKIRKRAFAAMLPAGCYIIPEPKKLTWTVAKEQIAATVFYVNSDALPATLKSATVDVKAKLNERNRSDNIVGMVPGTVRDSYIVFSAHYDHLGMMGEDAIFPGASDNASGTAMLLYLARYFAAHPQRYSMLFIAFSGEEAGLMGSAFFVAHPLVPLSKIKFLTNVDIMGDATDGVTVVNATEYPKEFGLLNKINDVHTFIPAIKSRGKAANSDHYLFSEAGVPAIFMYSNGGKGHYHDIYDTAVEIMLTNIDGVARLLIDLAIALNGRY